MKNTLSVRQVCFMLIAYNAATKLLTYPSAAAGYCGNDLIFPMLFNLVLQTVMIWSVAYLSSKTDKTFFALIEDSLGRAAARVIYALLALYFLFIAVIPLNEQQLLVHDCFYDTVPSIYVFLPFFFFSVYAGAKSFSNAGRCADICLPIFAAAAICIFAMSVGEASYSNLAPVLRRPFKEVANGMRFGLFRFSESAFLLVFFGRYKYRRGDAAKLTISYAAGGLAVVALTGIFYCIYGSLTPSRTFLLNNISVFFPVVSFVGRIDLLAVYALDIAVLFAIVLHIQACVHCLSLAFNFKNMPVLSLLANGVLFAVTLIFNNKSAALHTAAANWFFIPVLVFSYALPLLCWTLKGRRAE